MKTTVDVPDELYRLAKAEAALRGRKLKDLAEEGLRLVIQTPSGPPKRRDLATFMKNGRGIVDSGLADLGSNAGHMTGFGRDASDR